MPKLATLAGDFAIARSVRARRGTHGEPDLGADRARNPLAAWATSRQISAASWRREKFGQRKPSDIFPRFWR
jgi:hypothetical protein